MNDFFFFKSNSEGQGFLLSAETGFFSDFWQENPFCGVVENCHVSLVSNKLQWSLEQIVGV